MRIGLAIPAARSSSPSRMVATPYAHDRALEDARHGNGAEAVRVGLDHGQKPRPRTLRDRSCISLQRAQIDFDPGAPLGCLH